MNKLDRFRFGGLHKRRLFMLFVLLILILIVSMMFLMFIGFFGSRAEIPRILATSELTSERIDGVGINVLEIPDTNIIDDPFFGKKDRCIFAQVSEASGNYIYFDPSEVYSFSNITAGNEVNILSIDGSGNMGLRYSGSASGFARTRFGVPVSVEDASGLWMNDPVIKSAEASGSLFLLTESGKLISDAALSPVDESSGTVFTDICAVGINVYALTQDGEIYVSTEAGPFTLLGACEHEEGVTASFIAVANGNIDVFFSDGSSMAYSSLGSVYIDKLDIIGTASGTDYMVLTDGENVFVSSNGLFLRRISQINDLIPAGDSITTVEARDSEVFLLTDYGRLIRIDMSGPEPAVSSCDISSIEPVDICPAGSEAVVAVTTDNQSYYVSSVDGSYESLGVTGTSVDKVMMYGSEHFLIRSGYRLYESSLMSALQVDLPISDGLVMEGDICIVKCLTTDTDSWDLYGDTELLSQGRGVSLIGTGVGTHAMSVLLDEPSDGMFENNLFYRIEVNMSSPDEGVNCSVWLEGETFGNVGLHATGLTDKEQTYSYVFAATEAMLSDETLRFNIAFEDEGIVNVSSVYVGLDRYDINSVAPEFTESIVASAPSALRFGSVAIGSNGYCDETFYGVGADSLERAMRLCKEAGANPWLVMGSSVSQSDVNDLLGYLCGSVSNEHGKLRIDNGTALPWSRQFDTIYIEIDDMNDAFPSDAQRGAYVSYVMGLLAKSEFYIDIKDKVVFIDGMSYEGGVMLSNADRHASQLTINATLLQGMPYMDVATAAVENAVYEAPRAAGAGGYGREYVSSLRIEVDQESGVTAADIVSTVLKGEAVFADMMLFDSDMDVGSIIATLRPLVSGSLMYIETLDPLDTSSGMTAELLNDSCETMLIDNDSFIYLVVANHSDSLQQFMILSEDYDTASGSYVRYSSEGRLLMERDLNSLSIRQVLQPGEYMVIKIPK
ncbi:MAG: hypothetical protein IJ757_02445 [Clostridiales bacterium]|nr:hypothetical protein [Clostridiales bacterium]